MKTYWREFSNTASHKDVLKQFSHVLFMKRKEVRSDGAGELDHAFASEQETFRAIRDVLERRQIYLQSKGIKNLGHKMDEDQRPSSGIHAGGASQLAVHVVAANLHIVCGTNPPKVSVRQHIVKRLRVFLEKFTGIDQNMLGGTA